MNKNLPIYNLLISEDADAPEQIEFVSLVDKPAIERNFMAFSKKQAFAMDEERRIITGPAMLPDMPIYRRDTGGEYYVLFDRANVMRAAQKFFRKGFHNKINLSHDSGQLPEGIYFFESIVTDSSRGITPPAAFSDAPEGSWFLSAKVDNSELWQDIKSGKYAGFSVEGLFTVEARMEANEPNEEDAEMEQAVKDIMDMLRAMGVEIVNDPENPEN